MIRSALLCASGIGDGLLMMIVAHHLKKSRMNPTVFHSSHSFLSPLFEEHHFEDHIPLEILEKKLEEFDHVFVENDNSERAWHLFRLRDLGKLKHVRFIFPTKSKNFKEGDFLFNPNVPVASNLAECCAAMLGSPYSKENDLSFPEGTYKKHAKRVVIHPTSNDIKRNWGKSQFLSLANLLSKEGYAPVFCVSPNEREEWESLGIEIPKFPSLKDVASYIYESGFLIGNDSGLGHLASNLGIETLTISGNSKRVKIWRPDWSNGKVLTPPLPLLNFKGINLRIRENYWQKFISVNKVFKTFLELAHESRRHLL
jgi:heptosyltransferase-3